MAFFGAGIHGVNAVRRLWFRALRPNRHDDSRLARLGGWASHLGPMMEGGDDAAQERTGLLSHAELIER